DNSPGPLHRVAFFDFLVVSQQNGADALLFEVERDAEYTVRELEHLAGHGIVDAVYARNAVSERNDAADLGDVDVDGVAADLLANDLGNLVSFYVHASFSFILSRWRVTLAS